MVPHWTQNDPRYWLGSCEGWRGKQIDLRFNLRRHFKKTYRIARKRHQSFAETFIDELVDTIVHEYAHAFAPANAKSMKGEYLAQLFAMYGRRTRR